RTVAILGLAADITHGLVQQHRDAPGLLRGGLAFDGDSLVRQHLAAELGHHLAVDAHPAARDPFIGFAAGAESQFGHAFGQAQRFSHGNRKSFEEEGKTQACSASSSSRSSWIWLRACCSTGPSTRNTSSTRSPSVITL